MVETINKKNVREKRTIKMSKSDTIFTIVIGIFLGLALLLVLYPLVYVVSSSFSSARAVTSGQVWLWPVEPTLQGYEKVFEAKQVLVGYKNSIINTVIGTCINLAMTMLAAYPLSRNSLFGKKVINSLFIFTMLFQGGLIPLYLVVKGMGLIDTRWSLMLPNAMTVYNMIVARTFFSSTIPEELREAASLDGCSEFGFFARIVLPLSKPIIAVLALMYAIAHWNSYFYAMVYLKSADLYTLQIALRSILLQNSIDITLIADTRTAMEMEGMRELLKYSLIVVASVPVLVIYPFAQKYFIKGMLIGAVKG